jgi:hypothetical protein
MIFQTDGRRMLFRINLALLGYSNCGAILNTRGGIDLSPNRSKCRSNKALLNWLRAWPLLRLLELILE